MRRVNLYSIIYVLSFMLFSSASYCQRGHVVSFDYRIDKRLSSKDKAELAIKHKGGRPALIFSFTRYSSELRDGSNNAKLLDMPMVGANSNGGNVQLWLGEDKVEVAVNGRLAGSAKGVKFTSRPEVAFTESNAIKLKGQCRIQKLAPIEFGDDFARVEDTADDSQWEVQSGAFEVNMSRNPGSSQSAFQLWSSAPSAEGIALAKSSRWFWKDLRLGVSILRPENSDGETGLVFNWLDERNYHLFMANEGSAQLFRVRRGKREMLKNAANGIQAGAWTRMDVVSCGGKVVAMIGGRPVMLLDDDTALCGRAGLYINNLAINYFDDFSARSATAEDFSATPPAPFGPCEQQWSDFSGKNFITDEYMAQWAHPRCFWHAIKDGMQVFRNRFFHDAAVEWHALRGQKLCPTPRIRIFTDGEPGDKGYSFTISKEKISVAKNRTPLKETKMEPFPAITAIKAGVNGKRISLEINGTTVIETDDSEPITSGFVAADLGETRDVSGRNLRRPDWRDSTLIKSTHRLDYSFEHAPSAWRADAGQWQGTHRWACVPKWSFFGGRGVPGPAECANGNAVLWNLRRVSGDFDLELFAAPMEGTPQRVHFAFPVMINVAFCADGENLGSGYNLVYGTYDVPSRLLLRDSEQASDASRIEPGLRLLANEWYRRMTQTWQHIRIQRRNGRIIVDAATHDNEAVYLGLKRIFDEEDKLPEKTGQFAVWTNGENGIAIARATLSFEASDGAGNMRRTFTASAVMSDGGRQSFTRHTNVDSGGGFMRVLSEEPLDLANNPIIEFDWRPGEKTRLSLLLSLRDQTAEVPLDGKEANRPFMIACAPAEITPLKDGWMHVKAQPAQALRDAIPDGRPMLVERIAIGSPYDSLEEIGGIGVNARGAFFDIADFKVSNGTPLHSRRSWLPRFHNIVFFNDFQDSLGDAARFGGYDGAAISLDKFQPASGNYSLKLYNQHVCGTAGISLLKARFTSAEFPLLLMKVRIPKGIEMEVVFMTNKGKFEYTLTNGADFAWNRIGAIDVPEDKWTDISIDLAKLLPKDCIVSEILLADALKMGSYQKVAFHVADFNLVPAISAGDGIELLGDGIAKYHFSIGGTESKEPFVTGTTADIASKLPDGLSTIRLEPAYADDMAARAMTFKVMKSASKIPQPPERPKPTTLLAPYVSYIPQDRLSRTSLDLPNDSIERLSNFGDMRIRRGAWLSRYTDDAATGNGCAEALNMDVNGFYSFYFKQGKWSPRRWPYFAFDYKITTPVCMLNFSLLVNDVMTIVEWTGPNGRGNYFWESIIGKSEVAVQDGKWHHVEVNLLEMLKATRFKSGLPEDLVASELATWATAHGGGGYVNPHNAQILIDNFTVYSNKGRNPSFEWRLPSESLPAAGYSFVLDQKPDTVPPETVTTKETTKGFDNLASGVWHFHIRAVGTDGKWGPATHTKIIIDE